MIEFDQPLASALVHGLAGHVAIGAKEIAAGFRFPQAWCPVCEGSGNYWPDPDAACSLCSASVVPEPCPSYTEFGHRELKALGRTCLDCGGSGVGGVLCPITASDKPPTAEFVIQTDSMYAFVRPPTRKMAPGTLADLRIHRRGQEPQDMPLPLGGPVGQILLKPPVLPIYPSVGIGARPCVAIYDGSPWLCPELTDTSRDTNLSGDAAFGGWEPGSFVMRVESVERSDA